MANTQVFYKQFGKFEHGSRYLAMFEDCGPIDARKLREILKSLGRDAQNVKVTQGNDSVTISGDGTMFTLPILEHTERDVLLTVALSAFDAPKEQKDKDMEWCKLAMAKKDPRERLNGICECGQYNACSDGIAVHLIHKRQAGQDLQFNLDHYVNGRECASVTINAAQLQEALKVMEVMGKPYSSHGAYLVTIDICPDGLTLTASGEYGDSIAHFGQFEARYSGTDKACFQVGYVQDAIKGMGELAILTIRRGDFGTILHITSVDNDNMAMIVAYADDGMAKVTPSMADWTYPDSEHAKVSLPHCLTDDGAWIVPERAPVVECAPVAPVKNDAAAPVETSAPVLDDYTVTRRASFAQTCIAEYNALLDLARQSNKPEYKAAAAILNKVFSAHYGRAIQ